MDQPVELKISEQIIRPIIEGKMNAAVVEAMGGHERIIEDMLRVWMSQRVDSSGNQSHYSSNKTRLEWLLDQTLKDAMKKALDDYLATKRDIFVREFEKFFASKKGSNRIVEAMQDGLCDSLKNEWRVSINLIPPNR